MYPNTTLGVDGILVFFIMKYLLALTCIALLHASIFAQKPTAIHNVDLIPMDSNYIARQKTVIVEDGIISKILPASEFTPTADYEVIDGTDRYLIPGLADMHMHLISDDRIDSSYADTELIIPVTYGVTRARIPIGAKRHLVFKRKAENGEVISPHLHVAGHVYGTAFSPNTLGIKVNNGPQAKSAVRALHTEGYESIKLTFGVGREIFDEVIRSAKELGMPVFGHYPDIIDATEPLAAGMHNEHLDQLLEVMIPAHSKRRSISGLGLIPGQDNLFRYVTDSAVASVASLAKQNNVWVTPTQSFFNTSFVKGQPTEDFSKFPEYSWVSTEVRDKLIPSWFWQRPPAPQRLQAFKKSREKLILELQKQSVGLLAGSDSPEGVRLYGIGLHYELQALREAGLSNFEVLRTATINPAIFLGIENEYGTIEIGKKADFVLLARNPLDNIKNTMQIQGLYYNRQWFSREQLLNHRQKAIRKLSKAKLLSNTR